MLHEVPPHGCLHLCRDKSVVQDQQACSDVQVEHLEMTEVQAKLYAEALESLRSAARSSGLQPGALHAAYAMSWILNSRVMSMCLLGRCSGCAA